MKINLNQAKSNFVKSLVTSYNDWLQPYTLPMSGWQVFGYTQWDHLVNVLIHRGNISKYIGSHLKILNL